MVHGGKQTEDFENEFNETLVLQSECVAVSSCTAALHMALVARDVSPNDEVIDPSHNYRIDEMRSAIGRVQSSKPGEVNERRERHSRKYRELLEVSDIR